MRTGMITLADVMANPGKWVTYHRTGTTHRIVEGKGWVMCGRDAARMESVKRSEPRRVCLQCVNILLG